MDKKYYVPFLIICAIIMAFIFYINYKADSEEKDIKNDVPQGKLPTGSDIETFSGTITAYDTGCFADATCSISVDGKKVILVTGGRAMSQDTPVGRLLGVESIGDLEMKIGAHANVYATTTPEGDYTLYGSNDYYVEVVEIEPE